MRAVRIANGEVHAVRNVDDENEKRTAIILACGPRLEVDHHNRNRFRVMESITIGCKICQYHIAPTAPEQGDEVA